MTPKNKYAKINSELTVESERFLILSIQCFELLEEALTSIAIGRK